MRISNAGKLGMLFLMCLESASCGGGDESSPVVVAVTGSDRTVAKGSHVTLDGSDSYGPGRLTYAWTLNVPGGSAAVLARADTAATTFTPDREGVYVATLVVASGGMTSMPDSLVITAENTPPTGHAGPDVAVYTGSAARLDGRGTDPTDDQLTFEWTIVSAPAGSRAVLDDSTTAAPTLIPDRDGQYELELVVRDESSEASPDRIVVTSYHHLEHSVVDAEYSRPLARLVMASDAPDGLYIRDADEGTETFVALPAPPTSVSVGPDGTEAAVGHDGSVSRVRLTDGVLLANYPVTADVADIVLAGNGYAYAIPAEDELDEMHCLNLSTGADTLAEALGFFYAGSRAKLHPSGTSMYHSMPQNFSVSDIAKWDVSSGTAEFLYDSPYFGEFQGCGDLWISQDGSRIFTRCGDAFQASATPAADMIYAGKLGGVDFIRHLDHSSVANKVAAIPDAEANPFGDPSLAHSVRVYGDSLVFERRIGLPPVVADGQSYPVDGRFVFISADGTRLFIIAQASAESGAGDFALVPYML